MTPRDATVVMAAGSVGRDIVAWLAAREPIAAVVVDAADPYRDEITAAARGVPVTFDPAALPPATWGILAWWPRLVRQPRLSHPRRGWVNIHPSYLPWNRGKHTSFWTLRDATPCGVSLHVADGGIDTGPLLAQLPVPVTWLDTGESVYSKCQRAAVALFTEAWDAIKHGQYAPQPQPCGGSFHAAAAIDAASRLDLDAPTTARAVLNTIRARQFAPHPTATFSDGGKRYSVTVEIREVAP